MSAAAKQMTALDEEGMIESDTITQPAGEQDCAHCSNRQQHGQEKFEDIEGRQETIALRDPASVPAGQYAEGSPYQPGDLG